MLHGTASATVLSFGGHPVELKFGEVSARMLCLEVAPLDAPSREPAQEVYPGISPPNPVEFTRVRDLTGSTNFAIGKYRVIVQAHPPEITVFRPDDSRLQELGFGDGADTNAMTFRTDAPVLGLGEGGDQFDRRGANYPLINGQRYRLALLGTRIFSPFLIGTDGWALWIGPPSASIDLRAGRGIFHPSPGASPASAGLYLVDAREPADALREFIRLTGAPAMPPRWALGYMQSHRTLSRGEDILAEARTFRQKQLPCDAFIFLGTGFCPAGWNLGHDSFQFNPRVFSRSAAKVLADLHADHLRVVLHVVPRETDYPSLHGQIPSAPGETLDTRDIGVYWGRHRELFAAGVDGWWPDEGDWLDAPSRLARHRMYYEGPLSDRPNVRPWNLQRNGCPGIARYGGWVWSGDISSSWKTLAAQIEVGLNSSLSVSPYWGTDTGGFYPSTNHEYTGELYARWFQFSAFCPSFRSHGRTWHLHLPWGWNTGETGPVESQPAPDPSELHNASVEPICRNYLNLRYRLLPYTYTLAREAHDTGLPMMRALWLHYPGDPEAAKLGDEYLWGHDLLVAPIVVRGAKSRRLYLPAGTWIDWWTGQKLEGRRWIERAVDLETMPIYARAGAIIPMDPVRQYTGQAVDQPTTLRVFPGADGSFVLYDDDGQSLEYLSDSDPAALWIQFRWDDANRLLALEPDARMKRWPGGEREFAVELAGAGGKIQRVQFRGTPVTIRL